MKIHELDALSETQIARLCDRNAISDRKINEAARAILDKVRRDGDRALKYYSAAFDNVRLKSLTVEKNDLKRLAAPVTAGEKRAIKKAHDNIKAFHESQLVSEKKVQTSPGVVCWRERRAIESVGLYVPGGTAVLPSTFLMLAIPARIAGCGTLVACSPPAKNGLVNRYVAYCAALLGVERIYLAGGAQAIAAMAFGTETVPKVEKIFGPGNRYVTHAKNLVSFLGAAAIDFPAGPSEVMVIADDSANPAIVAGDLLSAADHGTDSQVVLISTGRAYLKTVLNEVESQSKRLARAEIIRQSLSKSFALHVPSIGAALEFSNRYAPEHLILSCRNYRSLVPRIRNAGSVFLGYYSPESAGDYASGTNHTLPTSGFARAYSGLSVDSFVKKITFQEISAPGISNLGGTIETFAEIEGLEGHKNAVTLRLNALRAR